MQKNGYVEKWLNKKAMFEFKFMTPQTRRLSVTIHILSYISRSKGNQAIKFHELIKYSVRNICLQKSCRK